MIWVLVLTGCGCPGDDDRPSRHDPRYPTEVPQADGPIVLDVVSETGAHTVSGDDELVLHFDLPRGLLAPVFVRLDLQMLVPPAGRAVLAVRGVVDDKGTTTDAVVPWTLTVPDVYAGLSRLDERVGPDCAPLHRFTPDLSPLLAEAISRGATHASFVMSALHGKVTVQQAQDVTNPECPGRIGARLELYPTVRSTFVAKELASVPSDTTAQLTMMSLVDTDILIDLDGREIQAEGHAGEVVHVFLDTLAPDKAIPYRVHVRQPGGAWESGPLRTLHTRRRRGEPFTFTVTSDGHFLNMEHRRAWSSMVLMGLTMDRAASEHPDFHLDLGDTFFTESYKAWDAADDAEAWRRHLEVRPYFERVGAPLFFVLGNHEGEQGWRVVAHDPIPERSEEIRTCLFPDPDDASHHQDYWAFEWGDVLVVGLDPFRHTVRKPHDVGGDQGSDDRWDWTLGATQVHWLARTLKESDAPFKIVFSHQLTGGTNTYGRGGSVAAAGPRSFEWGGGGLTAEDTFAEHRPGWSQPIQEILADAGVIAFVHGHDHKFVWEPPLDGVAYVTVPQPGDATYGDGYSPPVAPGAVVVNNAGHLRFTATPGQLEMAYVRSYLPGDGDDGEVAFAHIWTAP